MWYRLEGKNPVKCTMEEAARREGESNQVVKTVDDWDGRMVSTVFLRLDHNMHRDGPPLLFETMVFTKDEWIEEDCRRCATWEEAEAQHQEMCDLHGVYRRKRFAKKTYGED